MSPLLRIRWSVLACLGLIGGTCAFAQETNAPTDVAPEPPSMAQPAISTNATAPADQGNLSLRPAPVAESEVPGSVTPGPESIPVILPTNEADDLAKHLLVVYNENDYDSRNLAEYYASRRNIPAERVLAITCPMVEQISRPDFESKIRQPILFYLLQKKWMTRQNRQMQIGGRTINLLVANRNDIWAIVLMRGVPLKIAQDPSDDDSMESDGFFKAAKIEDPGLKSLFNSNQAAVDSELALLPVFGLPRGGFVPNVFFDVRGTGQRRVGSELAKNIVLVTRLDGPTSAQVKRMIDDCLYAEKNRLAGLAVIDSRGITDPKNGVFPGDVWLRNSRALLARDGWQVKFDDKPEVLPATDPVNQVAIYLGWYSGTAEGPWITAPTRFVPGAIAYHLHSFNADTIRSETSNWVGPLIAHGADATMGTVYEPLLGWTPHEDIFTKRMLDGNYFAEAAYASIEGLSWMVTVVGDPLYRPFLKPLDAAIADAATPRTEHDDWLLLQQMQRQLIAGQIPGDIDRLQGIVANAGAGPVAEEYLADLLQKARNAQTGVAIDQAYKKAIAGYALPIDKIRVGEKLAQYYRNNGQGSRAQAQIDMLRQQFPADAARFGLGPPIAPVTVPAPKIATSIPPLPSHSPPSYDKNNHAPMSPPAPPNPPKPPKPSFPNPAPVEQ